MPSPYCISRVAVNNTDWTPVRTPIASDSWSLVSLAGANWCWRTTANDDQTEKTVYAYNQEVVLPSSRMRARFAKGSVIGYAKSFVESDTLICTWVGM